MIFLGRSDWQRVGTWAALSLVLHLAWEIAQLPLYTIGATGSLIELASAVAHCGVGDLLIATGAFILTMFALGESNWPHLHPWKGATIAMAFGVAYTAYSEWYNVYQAGNWAYAPAMPRVLGLGLSPLLQWLVVPAVTVVIWRRLLFRSQARQLKV